MTREETVVLVHGLWTNGLDMTLLRTRVRRAGYRTRQFSCATVSRSPGENARELGQFIAAIDGPVVHYLCHSLGGIVVRHLFHADTGQRPGRIVTLGTPHQASSAARQFQRFPFGHLLLGKSYTNGLNGNLPAWPGSHDLGSIAGTLRLGLGLLVPGIPRPSDGTVAVAETRLEGMRDHLSLEASHFGLLLSARAAEQSINFFHHGRFDHGAA